MGTELSTQLLSKLAKVARRNEVALQQPGG
jgi:hypothetical protein